MARAATFSVLSNGNTGANTLRAAITSANATPGQDTITFNIPGAGVMTITLASSLPTITERVVINGFTQPGSVMNTISPGSNAVMLIEINGNNTVATGLTVSSSYSLIQGLVFNRFTTNSLVLAATATYNDIRGCYFGLNPAGTAASGTGNGVLVQGSYNEMGSWGNSEQNRFSGSTGNAALRYSGASATSNYARNNVIGMSANGTTVIGGIQQGVRFESGANWNQFGEIGCCFNYITGATGAGVVVLGATTDNNNIAGNAIWGNGGLGIDLGNDGVTLNDIGDGDTGPNQGQNFPVIQAAMTDEEGRVYVRINMVGPPNTEYRFDFYANMVPDPSGYGEGQEWIGTRYRSTDGSGNLILNATAGAWSNIPNGTMISCTATEDGTWNTSEFSQNVACYAGRPIVTNTSDVVNGNTASIMQLVAAPGADGISLREAIMAANNNLDAWTNNYIYFDLPGSGPQTITPLSPLPSLQTSITLDGWSDPDYSGTPVVHISGVTAGAGANGFTLDYDWCMLYALSVTDFSGDGIHGNDGISNGEVVGCHIGVLPNGTACAGNSGAGIHIHNGESWYIGSDWTTDQNVISGNALGGILVEGPNALNNRIMNSRIGTNLAGTASCGTQPYGVRFKSGAHDNLVGHDTPSNRNLISGNTIHGVYGDGDANQIINNYIGTNAAGAAAIPNTTDGINTFGTNWQIRGNTVSGNGDDGIDLKGSGHTVIGNIVGANAAGTADVPNVDNGIQISASPNNIIGDGTVAGRNLVSGNTTNGVFIGSTGSTNNQILGNYIGTNLAGTAALANGDDGVNIEDGTNNIVGGANAGKRNIISGNGDDGVDISKTGTSGNSVMGNYIGLNATGTAAIQNYHEGVVIETDASANFIGGTAAGEGNVISGNRNNGILIQSVGAINNQVLGNFIGTSPNGLAAIPNRLAGVLITGSASTNIIGGTNAGARNVISGNADHGIWLNGTAFTTVQGNIIGLNAAGIAALGNGHDGIAIENSNNNIIGGSTLGAGNTISANLSAVNLADGIYVGSGSNNVIQGNRIGTDISGNGSFGNFYAGISNLANSTRIGGTAAGEGNVIRNNGQFGVRNNGSGVRILGNSIDLNGGLGIDLNSDGVTANDPLDPDTGPNGLQNYPVIDLAITNGGNTFFKGTFNSTPGRNFRLEFFSSPAQDATGFGEGATYLGTTNVTTDASGDATYALTLTGVPATVGHFASATATDLSNNNTSEFSGNQPFISGFTIAGTVFEDMNYGGGAGRDRTTALGNGGSARPNARVELYDGSGNYLTFANTDASGAYAFSSLMPGTYGVRVVNSTVSSSRAGWSAALIGVQTFKTNASTGTALAVTNHVGGQVPDKNDASNGSTTLGALATPTLAPQSISAVTIGSASINGVDFGFSFDVIVNTNDVGQGTLRQLVANANALGGDAALAQQGLIAGKENAVFMISNGTSAPGLRAANNYFVGGRATISPQSNTTFINSTLVLNAQLQPGFGGTPIVELDGTNAGTESGLRFSNAANSVVRGLVINRFPGNGLYIVLNSNNCVIAGNYLGTDHTGTIAHGNGLNGIMLQSNVANTVIGGTTELDRNLLSGNDQSGAALTSATVVNTVFIGNYIGTDVTGNSPLPNSYHGVDLLHQSLNTVIGGTAPGSTNVISGNTSRGISVTDNATVKVIGNFIGTDHLGTSAIPNGGAGVDIFCPNNTVGGATAAERNIISGNAGPGVRINNAANTNNIIWGNYIGTDVTGTNDLGNTMSGVLDNNSTGTKIGGSLPGQGNVISGNNDHGILLQNSNQDTIQGNIIGLNASGTAALRNESNGIGLTAGGNHLIGGTTSGARNIISAQSNSTYVSDGIYIASSNGNRIQGNFIGTDITGALPFPNYSAGIACDGDNNIIGGTGPGEGNLMAFNGRFGIRVGNTSIGNNIRQNSMHDNGELGIDLNADGVSLNDLNDVDNGGNGRLNIPVITETRILGGNLFLKGYARPGATMEFFISDNDATGFGEGKTYLFTVVEGSGADGDATTGTYGPAAVNGTVQGTDNTNKFSFTVPVPGSVVNGTKLTATATLANNTSEFSARTTATLDLDYDDDGIPDLAEGFCTPISNNSDAEEPLITGPTPYIADYGSIRVYDAGQVPYWSTTAVDNAIEIWNNANSTSVPHCDANTGNQFMELNANYVASNYQDIATIPNSVITWSVAHRGRDGVDVATVSIGAPGSVAVQQTMTDGNLAWVTYSGIYVVPAGQSTTRFQFDAVSSSSGDPAAGNFIDSFTLSCSNDADTDGDGIPDYKDLDSDNDGIYDCVESGVNKPFTNGVLDGPVNPNGIPVAADTDGDGVIDYLIKDSDSDGIYDFTELDSDGDGCPDVIEAGFTDVNSDGTPGPAPITVSGNGLVTSIGP